MHNSFIIIFYCLIVIILNACSKNNEEEIKPPTCDTSNVTYSATIRPLFEQHCTSCHSSGKINLTDYESTRNLAIRGDLMAVISYNGPKKMPPSGKLPDCDIARVRTWIEKGAKND
ncbi:MAG: cytochrome c [Bacteroidia bacterium]|nr:cytochrome c [Bacteroidia bacterium]MDW8157526.1 cytochrome c [Bacteroidia bacterium]